MMIARRKRSDTENNTATMNQRRRLPNVLVAENEKKGMPAVISDAGDMIFMITPKIPKMSPV